MPTNRTRRGRASKVRITPEMIELFRRAREKVDAGQHQDWEEQGGRRREYLDACLTLHSLLGRKPWEIDVLDAAGDAPPRWENRTEWMKAVAIRRALDTAGATA